MPVRNNSIIIEYHAFQDMLDEFESLVNQKIFKKISYNMWRSFSRMEADVELRWNAEKVVIHCDGSNEQHCLCFGDDSFADFLFEHYISNRDWVDPYHEYWEYDGSYWDNETISELKKINSTASTLNAISIEDATIANIKDTLIHAPIGICAQPAEASISINLDTKVDKAEFDARIKELTHIIEKHTKNDKENENMNAFKFDFGPVNGNAVRMSMYGLAVKNKVGTFVSYDAKSGDIMDVDVFNFDGANFLYRMPVAMKDIEIGDVVIHHNAPMFVVGKSEDNKGLIVVDVIAGERKEVMLAKSPFGFNFATKVVNFLGNAFNGTASADNPFGNMWMLFALSGDNKDMNDMLPMMMMANGGNIDPNMLMFMAMSGKGNNDMLPMLMMMNMNANAAPAHECKCGGNCGQHQ